ncbi:MAG: glycoside hydrolase family 43 protein [Thermoguttaceae bacterium]|nr:glycoside hydrolase family 43 protein [Thermoguttaceae bacterium]
MSTQRTLSLCMLFAAFFTFLMSSNNAYSQDSEPGKESGYYVFSYFMNNGEDGVHYAVSRDGYQWKALNNSQAILAPPVGKTTKLTRDPSIVRGENGVYHMVWTVAWDGRSFGHAWSKDLIEWNDAQAVPCMEHAPATRNVWAPELFYDKASQLYYILWSSTIPGAFSDADTGTSETKYDHRVYYTTTKDFKTFTDTKLYFDPGHNTIDAFLSEKDGRYYLFYKDETLFPEAQKTILIADGETPVGPFSEGKVISAQNWVEGPSALVIGNDWIVYYDRYIDNKYGAVRSRNGGDWQDVAELISFPKNARHGTAFEVDQDTYERLVEKYGIDE